jgi:hypothetical protein
MEEALMDRGSYIQIADGQVFDPLDPDPGKITIEVVARALSNLCRFTGHVGRFYSVAEHSVHVSRMVPPDDALWAIMHDAPEGMGLGDLASPLKGTDDLGRVYKAYESQMMEVIAERFGLPPTPGSVQPETVTAADESMREIERLQLLPRTPEGDELWAEWPADSSLVPEHCWPQCWPPDVAMAIFIDRFREVGGRG